jgi:glutamate 5-kinase
MSSQERQALMGRVRSVVVKLGTNVLANERGLLDEAQIVRIIDQVVAIQLKHDVRVTVVSSGAIAAGMGDLALAERPDSLPELQACAAVGQAKLMMMFDEALKRHGRHAAQILLVRSDIEDRARYLNISHCITALQEYGAVPIIMVTNLLKAELLVLLTTVDGVFRDKARKDRFDIVADMTDVKAAADDTRSSLGSGGMPTKLLAAESVVKAGEMAVIANGRLPNILLDLLAGEPVGTLFVPAARRTDAPAAAHRMTAKQRWIGLTRRPRGTIAVDAGAAKALQARKSLLASGITGVEGEFVFGDVVAIVDPAGTVIAQGQTNYSSEDISKIKGLRTSEFAKALGDKTYDEVIHASNLVLNI